MEEVYWLIGHLNATALFLMAPGLLLLVPDSRWDEYGLPRITLLTPIQDQTALVDLSHSIGIYLLDDPQTLFVHSLQDARGVSFGSRATSRETLS